MAVCVVLDHTILCSGVWGNGGAGESLRSMVVGFFGEWRGLRNISGSERLFGITGLVGGNGSNAAG